MSKVKKLGHIVLFVQDPIASAKWYCDVLGMEAVVLDERIPAAFLSFDQRDHDIALFKVPDDRKLGHRDIEHVSSEINGTIEDFKQFHAMLEQKGIEILGLVDHGISYGLYFLDPDGHHLEVFYQHEQDDEKSKSKFREIGAFAQPITLDDIVS